MGFVYYGYYSLYYEQARTEMIRKLGISYRELEESGLLLPVIRMNAKYVLPAKYDELLTVKVCVPLMPTKKIGFKYEVYNEENQLINIAETDLLFMDAKTKRIVRAPQMLIDKMEKHYD